MATWTTTARAQNEQAANPAPAATSQAASATCRLPASPRFALILHLHAWALHPSLAPTYFVATRSRWETGGFSPRPFVEASWRLLAWPNVPEHLSVHLRQEILASVGSTPLWLEHAAQLPLVGLAADVRARQLGHERWTSLAVRRQFDGASVEMGFEGLSSEPMAAMERKGTGARALRRAGAVVAIHAGARRSALSIWTPPSGLSNFGPANASLRGWRLCPVMLVHGHVRRWLGHGDGPHMDLRWKAEAALTAQHRASGVVAQLRGHAAWRQVVGARGQIVQVGSFPSADEAAGPVPHILYEPLRGHEDFARYTAHVFSAEVNATVRLRPALAVGAFMGATQLDHLSQPRKVNWLAAAGPVATARLPFGPAGLTVRLQSALRTGGYEAARWLHLVTVGV